MTYEEIRDNVEIREFIKKGNANLRVLGFTEHSEAHCALVAERAADILRQLEFEIHEIIPDRRTTRLWMKKL